MALQKRSLDFPSADGQSTVSACYYFEPHAVKVGIVQILHGMAEHKERYLPFITFLARKGYFVCIHDHLGHGDTSKPEDYGFFAEKEGAAAVLQDVHTLHEKMRALLPRPKYFLLGHSMGSFFARAYAAKWGDSLSGLILSGTGGPNPQLSSALRLINLLRRLQGDRKRSTFVQKMMFGQYNARIESPISKNDWLSTDQEVVAAYDADPRCGFPFTLSADKDLMLLLQSIGTPRWAVALPKNLPVLFISGEEDPVGGYGQGARAVAEMLKTAGLKQVEIKLYPGMRHEVLNEVGKQTVYEDVNRWLTDIADPYMHCICQGTTIHISRKCPHCSFSKSLFES